MKVCVDSDLEDLLLEESKELGFVCKVFLQNPPDIFIFDDITPWYHLKSGRRPRWATSATRVGDWRPDVGREAPAVADPGLRLPEQEVA